MNIDNREDMNIVIVGHVDHGKSTIIGRLLADTFSLPEGKLQQIKDKCRRNSKSFEYAFLLDALKDEREQGITIDTARCFFKTEKREYIILDAPGHIEFLKNMITGAARAEAALIVIDANEGIQENSKRHGYMLSMLGIDQVAVLVNKMDLVDYNEKIFNNIKKEYEEFLYTIGINSEYFIPVSGVEGDNIVNKSEKTLWYSKDNVLEVLDGFKKQSLLKEKPFRMHVQGIYKFTNNNDNRRIVAGTINAGSINIGDKVAFYPSGKKSRIKSIEAFNKEKLYNISSGFSAGFTLEEQVFIKRGEVMVKTNESFPKVSSRIKVNLFWLGKSPLIKNKQYLLKIGTTKVSMVIEKIILVMNGANLFYEKKDIVERHHVAECIIKTKCPIAYDLSKENPETSRFVIVDNYEISGGGTIQEELEDAEIGINQNILFNNLRWHKGKVTKEDRYNILKQKPIVVWLSGLSASGKSTIAVEVEKRLNQLGKPSYRLDGDNIRQGLNSDLGFTYRDREENIRRITEVAKLFHDAGIITLVSFITPLESMRKNIREIIGDVGLIEVYVKASIETCIKRDPKGLYKKAQKGLINEFTGISSPFEEPQSSDLILDTDVLTIDEAVSRVVERILETIEQ